MSNSTQTELSYESYFKAGINYTEYKDKFQEEMHSDNPEPYAKYLPQNWSRQSRLDRKLKLKPELLTALEKLDTKLNWLVITEHWCGDASQINPVIQKVAEQSNGRINLRFVYRDEHEELMDAHLTDGRSRSIPILLSLDDNFKLIASYGPRPDEAQRLVKQILSEGGSYAIPVHTWYAKDKQKAIQSDLLKLIPAA